MSSHPAPAPASPIGLLGHLRSWWKAHPVGAWAQSDGPLAEAQQSAVRFSGAVRVLVADDDPVNLMVISAQLESRGLVPLLAADGAEALALACELPFDLILMDLQMPLLDGLDATAAIRRFEAESGRPPVPVIACTSLSPARSQLAAHGFNGVLRKPCDEQALSECLVRWCPTYSPSAPTRPGHPARLGGRPARRPSGQGGASAR